jgi:hypothetical protein
MSEEIDNQQLMRKFLRGSAGERQEVSFVESPGARAGAWAVKVKSLGSYNVYNVRRVEIGDAGSMPVEIGEQTQAVNLAEPFDEQGQLAAGVYAVMFRVGEKNVFCLPV